MKHLPPSYPCSVGSIPRPHALLAALASWERGEISAAVLAAARDDAVRDTIRRLEQAGSPVVTDGEQAKPSFATYPPATCRQPSSTPPCRSSRRPSRDPR